MHTSTMEHLTEYILSTFSDDQKLNLYSALEANIGHLVPGKMAYHVFRVAKVGRLAYDAPYPCKKEYGGLYWSLLMDLCEKMKMELVFIHDVIHEKFEGGNDGVGFFLNDGIFHKVTDLNTLDPEIAELIPDPRGERADGKSSICFRVPEGCPILYDDMKLLDFCSIYQNDGIIKGKTSKGTVVINEYAQACD